MGQAVAHLHMLLAFSSQHPSQLLRLVLKSKSEVAVELFHGQVKKERRQKTNKHQKPKSTIVQGRCCPPGDN